MEQVKDQSDEALEYVSTYSRADAIRDGVLIDVSEVAREVGFQYPVAITTDVYSAYVSIPMGVTGQDEQGRLWDILWMCRVEISRCCDKRSELLFEVLVRNPAPTIACLKSLCHGGDDGEPVITIMLPSED